METFIIVITFWTGIFIIHYENKDLRDKIEEIKVMLKESK